MMSARIFFRWVCATAIAYLCFGWGYAAAQLTPSMIADRPSQLYPVTTPGMVQLETGLSYESSHHDEHLEHSSSSWLLAMLLRSGIFEGAELRIGFEYVNEAQHMGPQVERGKGLRNISIGTKIELMEEDEWMPTISLFANAHLPFGQDDYRPHELIPGARLQADYDFDHKVMLTGNIGGEYLVGASELLTTYTTTVAVPVDDRLTAFGDIAGQFSNMDRPAHAWDVGVMYAVHEHLQIDLAGGGGITNTAPTFFFNSGFSYRIP